MTGTGEQKEEVKEEQVSQCEFVYAGEFMNFDNLKGFTEE